MAESLTEIPRDAQKKRPFKEKGGGDRGSKHTPRKSGDASKTKEGEESIVFCRKKAYARSSLEAKSLIAQKREERF